MLYSAYFLIKESNKSLSGSRTTVSPSHRFFSVFFLSQTILQSLKYLFISLRLQTKASLIVNTKIYFSTSTIKLYFCLLETLFLNEGGESQNKGILVTF